MVGTGGLFWTLFYTRKAVKAAEAATQDADKALAIANRNADAARDQVAVAERGQAAQLRPYLYPSIVGFELKQSDRGSLFGPTWTAWIHFSFENFGATPAKSATIYVVTSTGHVAEDLAETEPPLASGIALGDIPPRFVKTLHDNFYADITRHKAALDAGSAEIILNGRLTYSDASGRDYETRFRLWTRDLFYRRGSFQVADTGNSAT